jgi:hypothetical protein
MDRTLRPSYKSNEGFALMQQLLYFLMANDFLNKALKSIILVSPLLKMQYKSNLFTDLILSILYVLIAFFIGNLIKAMLVKVTDYQLKNKKARVETQAVF